MLMVANREECRMQILKRTMKLSANDLTRKVLYSLEVQQNMAVGLTFHLRSVEE